MSKSAVPRTPCLIRPQHAIFPLLIFSFVAVHASTQDWACGVGLNPNGNYVDLSDPVNSGPFHDLTVEELRKLRTFVESEPAIKGAKTSSETTPKDSYLYLADLWMPPKSHVLQFLDGNGPQPPRQARVMMFRGDKSPPVVEEWICGPLPEVQQCELLSLPKRRNPVEFESRPFNHIEFAHINSKILTEVDAKVGHILRESYNATFLGCDDHRDCLIYNGIPYASGLTGQLNQRRMLLWGLYNVPFPTLHPVDFGLLLQLDGSDSDTWGIVKIWYGDQVFDSLERLVHAYDSGNIIKSKIPKPEVTRDLFSTLYRRGEPTPVNPQRAPMQVEPDGKRYTLDDRKVTYLDWSFNFRMSSFSGPALFDIRFQGERIAYELSLSELATYHSGMAPAIQINDIVNSFAVSGLKSRSLVPGGDCPDHATLVNLNVLSMYDTEPGRFDAAFCLFEHNNGYPLRRHSSFSKPCGFYGGMMDSVLILRAALSVGSYDDIIDFIFHQNGVLETRLMSSGYIRSSIFSEVERRYGFRIHDNIVGNMHQHLVHLKADVDINGVTNRYETLDIVEDKSSISWDSDKPYGQTKFEATLKKTEKDALYKYSLDQPKYHIVHNDAERSAHGEKRAFRIHLSGMSKNLIPEDHANEPAISWARHQMAVTHRKEEEFRSSSSYAMQDSLRPVVNFSDFYADNDSIVDEDLVFWLTLSWFHIPHSEDLPISSTVGRHYSAFLSPYNYYSECPSMSSRDAILVEYKDIKDPAKGVTVDRNGNSRDTCMLPIPTLEADVAINPDLVLESERESPV